jgi:RNA polymerase sigma-70 factor, ECF subfamily
VYGVALRLARDEAEAADVTQEVYLKVMRYLHQFAGHSRFTTWLYRIVVTTASDRRQRWRPLLRLDEVPEGSPPVIQPAEQESALLEREAARRLQAAVAELPRRLRLPLVLRYVAGSSYREISEALAISEGTVASRLSRGQRRLALAYRAADGEDRQ